MQGIIVQLLEIVRGEEQPVLPVEPQPPDVGHDGIHILHFFLAGVGVIEPEVADAVEFGGDAEVEADGLGVADVEVAVGLRRKAGHHPAVLARGQVVGDDLADKIQGTGGLGSGHSMGSFSENAQIYRENVSKPGNNSSKNAPGKLLWERRARGRWPPAPPPNPLPQPLEFLAGKAGDWPGFLAP